MKVENMISSRGNKVPNQFIITEQNGCNSKEVFQSYNTIIVEILNDEVHLDKSSWDYSRTTGKYRNQFLGETKKETQAKIDNGTYILTDLN